MKIEIDVRNLLFWMQGIEGLEQGIDSLHKILKLELSSRLDIVLIDN